MLAIFVLQPEASVGWESPAFLTRTTTTVFARRCYAVDWMVSKGPRPLYYVGGGLKQLLCNESEERELVFYR
jgi:hypothetical protein